MEYLIGFIIGGLLGLTGAGGSLFAVPLIMFGLGLKPVDAMGIALAAVAVSAGFGVWRQHARVLWLPALILAAGGLLAAPLGKWVALRVPDQWLMGGFSLLAIAIAVHMWREAVRRPEAAKVIRATAAAKAPGPLSTPCRFSDTGFFQWQVSCLSALVTGGLGIGFISGLFGVGGGFLIVPYLLFLSSVSMVTAVSTSLLVIVVISTGGFLSHLMLGEALNLLALPKIMVAGIVGMLVSQKIGRKIAGPNLQKLFATLLLLVSSFTLLISLPDNV